mgnify:CR=1 FL=1
MNYKDIIAPFYDYVKCLYRLVYTNIILAIISENCFILSTLDHTYTPTYPQLYTLVYTNYLEIWG